MHRSHRPARRLLPLAVVLSALAGCGGPRTYPVEGMVTFPDGTPLQAGQVVFEAKDPNAPKVSPRGDIGPNGAFRLGTYQAGDGAPAGDYRVMLVPPPPPGERPVPPPFDVKYTQFEASGLEFTVAAGKNNYPIQVTRPSR